MRAEKIKITVIGAGSYFFGRPVIHKMAVSPALAGGTLALVDTDPRALKVMAGIAEKVFRHTGCGARVIAAADRRKVLADSDFVVLTFSHRNAHYRGVDTRIAAQHGIRMCSSDTIGPGGIFRALREIPRALAMARDVALMAPQAWLINFVNPTAVLGMALRRYAPAVRSFALCDGNHEPHNTLTWLKRAGILPASAASAPPGVLRDLELKIGGVNHCTWLVKFNYRGRDMLPRLRQWVAKEMRAERINPSAKAKPRYNFAYMAQLFDLYGAIPTAVSHTKEYVPFYQGYGVRPPQPEPLRLFDAKNRAAEMAAAWRVNEQYARGSLPVTHFLEKVRDDHATDIIESMWGGLGRQFYINSANRGAVTNLSADAFLELRCDLDLRGPRPQPFGAMPRGLLALQQQVLDAHELAAEAAVTGDRAILRRAVLTDPLCNNIGDADACIRDLLRAERAALPPYWFRRGG